MGLLTDIPVSTGPQKIVTDIRKVVPALRAVKCNWNNWPGITGHKHLGPFVINGNQMVICIICFAERADNFSSQKFDFMRQQCF